MDAVAQPDPPMSAIQASVVYRTGPLTPAEARALPLLPLRAHRQDQYAAALASAQNYADATMDEPSLVGADPDLAVALALLDANDYAKVSGKVDELEYRTQMLAAYRRGLGKALKIAEACAAKFMRADEVVSGINTVLRGTAR